MRPCRPGPGPALRAGAGRLPRAPELPGLGDVTRLSPRHAPRARGGTIDEHLLLRYARRSEATPEGCKWLERAAAGLADQLQLCMVVTEERRLLGVHAMSAIWEHTGHGLSLRTHSGGTSDRAADPQVAHRSCLAQSARFCVPSCLEA
eukprot:scaffold141350_cov193-Phaeocystis_antarctica.AAC.1